jgi:3-isopropylmalate/(R)-2-methylmalate dehydratase small subunit
MERFTKLDAIACPLGLANVDTDQIIPARFMKTPRAAGYGRFLLHDLRFGADGALRLDFALNDPRFAGSSILVARRNFGTGSSREAAVYALWDYGIRCVVAPSFGDIFASNAVKNGLLPATVDEADVESLVAALSSSDKPRLLVDLSECIVALNGRHMPFSIDTVRRLQLLNGWDDIDMTDRHRDRIAAYRVRRLSDAPWAWPPVTPA